MDPSVKAKRLAIARNRMQIATRTLAERYRLADQIVALDQAERTPMGGREVVMLEATADLLDALVATDGALAADATPASEMAALDAITPGLADKLVAAGFTNVVDVREASDDDLKAIRGIAAATIRKMRAEIGYPVSDDEPDEPTDDAEAMESEPE